MFLHFQISCQGLLPYIEKGCYMSVFPFQTSSSFRTLQNIFEVVFFPRKYPIAFLYPPENATKPSSS